MRVILAEKPSVAQSIAAVLGANQKRNGYLQGENDIVSWCIGHLIELAPPEIYDARYAKWRREDLPIVPSVWESVVSDGTKKQFAVLKDLLNRTDVDEVVCATDAGREGELIFRMVYEKTGCTKPVKRLWISSLEESAIREGFRALKPGTAYDALYRAALCRAQADWLVGINGTRLYSRLYGTKLNVGRVMTPTLAMVVQREKEIAAFQVERFYTVQLSCGFPAQSGRIKTREEAERIRASCHCKKAAVKQIERRQKKEKPPKLYDLTALQRDANRIYGYTAQQTLDYAQTLYEKKLATYPRTDSRFLTHDLRDRLPALIECVAQVLPFASGLPLAVHTQQVIRDEKVSDHHAIIPTQNMTREALAQLPMGERSILTLLAVRLLAATGESCETDEVTVTLDCEGHDFTAKGSTVRQMGYRMFEETFRGSLGSRERKEQEYPIPPLEIGQIVGPVVATIREGQTTPPKRYTDVIFCERKEWIGIEERSSA
ncbi:MAG: DNA topoisomerase [Christensenellales bacterium]|nr:DNA topoisomerase [Christensenellales bacterium]